MVDTLNGSSSQSPGLLSYASFAETSSFFSSIERYRKRGNPQRKKSDSTFLEVIVLYTEDRWEVYLQYQGHSENRSTHTQNKALF